MVIRLPVAGMNEHLLEGFTSLSNFEWLTGLRNELLANFARFANDPDAGAKKFEIYDYCLKTLFPSWINLQEELIRKVQTAKYNEAITAGQLSAEIGEIQKSARQLIVAFCNKVEEIFPRTFSNSGDFQTKTRLVNEEGLSTVAFIIFILKTSIKAPTTPLSSDYQRYVQSQGFALHLTSKARDLAKEIWAASPGEREFPNLAVKVTEA